jgi:CelD/BcsL family acetyltransferase involved in cellulose biosynthesis
MLQWQRKRVTVKFQLGERTVFTRVLWLKVCDVPLRPEAADGIVQPPAPDADLDPGCAGFLLRSLPVDGAQPRWRVTGPWLCYTPLQFQRYYIDLRQSFDDYRAKFSSKSRSTLNRKVRRFAQRCGGEVRWRRYASVAEMREFHRLARIVSAKSYQERLLDAGLPDSGAFVQEMESLAQGGQVRAFVLFDGETPIAYLYCPVRENVLLYQFLGYDPAYMEWSPGTVLQWQALESIFAERRFALFDFTEGQSEHKRFFATGSVRCANVFFLRRTLPNLSLVLGHIGCAALSEGAGALLDRLGVKARVKKFIRFGV